MGTSLNGETFIYACIIGKRRHTDIKEITVHICYCLIGKEKRNIIKNS